MARMIRDWTDSEKIHKLTAEGERFFTRLIMKADDFGRYVANVKLLRASLFPLWIKLKEDRIENWVKECEDADLILSYEVDGKKYLEIKMYDQKLRVRRSKYPPSNPEERLSLSQGYVYLIGTDFKSPIKIGFSVNPWSRLKEININHPQKLEILFTTKADKKLESEIHKAIKELRVKNEWFDINNDILDCLSKFNVGELDRESMLRSIRSISSLHNSPPEEKGREVENEVEEKRVLQQEEGIALNLLSSNLFRQAKPPTKNQVWEVFSRAGGTKEMAKSFFEKHESTGWFLNGSPIIHFSSLANKFIDTWKRNDEEKGKKQAGTGNTPMIKL